MARPLKIFLIVIGSLFVLVAGSVLAAAMLFDPNDYTAQITAAAEKETGRKLELGKLELSVFPWLAVGAENVKLANAQGFGAEPFAEVGKARVGVKIWPLLTARKVEISTVTLTGLRLRLAVDKDGRNNWSDLSKDDEKEEPKAEGEMSFKLEDLDIGGIDIEDSAVSYSDAQAGKSYSVEKLSLKTGDIALGEPIDLKLAASVAASAPAVAADIDLAANVSKWDLEAKSYVVEDLSLKVKGKGQKMLQGQDAEIAAELTGKLLADLGKQAQVSDLKLSFDGGSSQLKLKGDYSGDLTYDLVTQVLSLPALALNANASGKGIPGGKQDVKVTGGLKFDNQNGAFELSKGQIAAAGLNINTSLKGSDIKGESPQIAGPLSIAPFNPRELMKAMGMTPPVTSDPKALSEASLNAQYKGTFKSATLSDVVLKLDQTTARGRIDVRDFATQALQFALNVDTLDADRYLSPKVTADKDVPQKQAEPASDSKGGINDIQLPAETLNSLNAEGTLDVAQLKVKGMKISNAQVKLAGGKGKVKSQQISAKLYGGTVGFNHQFTPGAKPGYVIKTSLSSLNASPFIKDFIGKDWIEGLGSFNINLSGNGLTVGDLRKALNGDIGVKIESGAVKGFNLGQVIRKSKALLAGQAAPVEKEPLKTDFTAMNFTAQIINGILKSDSLNAMSPLFRVNGEGEINLVNETINYLAKPTIVASSQGEGGKGLEELKGIMIPIKLSGNLFSPSYKLDLQTALKQQAMSKVNEKLDAKKAEFEGKKEEKKEELKQKLNDKLNKWLTPKPKPQEPAPAAPAAPAEQPKT